MPTQRKTTEHEPTEEEIRREAHPEWYSDPEATAVDQAPPTEED